MDIKKQLGEFIAQKRKEKEEEENYRRERNEADRSAILKNVAGDLASALIPALEKHLENSQMTAQEIRSAIKEGMQDAIEVNMPEIHMPEMHMPEIKVDVSAIERAVQQGMSREFPQPIVNIPETIFPERMRVELDGVDRMKPLPMLMVDVKGKPMQFGSSVSGGGKSDFFTIKDIRGSTASLIDEIDGALKVTGSLALSADYGSGEIGSNTLRIVQASDAISSVNVVDAFGSTAVDSVFNSDNRLRVSVETGGSGLTDSELRASSVPVAQASGALWSVSVVDVFGSTGTNVVNPDGRLKVELPTGSSGLTDTELRATSVPVEQVSGSNWSTNVTNTVTVTGTLTSTGAYLLNGDGTYRGTFPVEGTVQTEQIGTWNIATVTAVTNITNSVAAALVDSSGVQYSTTNPLPIDDAGGSITIDGSVSVTGSITSTVVVGVVVSDAAANGDAPLKIGGIARTANPTAVANADMVSATYDDVGRQVVKTHQVRDLIQTAYVSVTNGTETTLRAAVAGSYLDLIMIVGSNNSDAAVSVDIRPVTGGNIINTLRIPANGTAGWTPQVPWPQTDTGNNWTVDGPDETGRTLTFSALFSQEV